MAKRIEDLTVDLFHDRTPNGTVKVDPEWLDGTVWQLDSTDIGGLEGSPEEQMATAQARMQTIRRQADTAGKKLQMRAKLTPDGVAIYLKAVSK